MIIHSYAEQAQERKSLRMLTTEDAMYYLQQADHTIEELVHALYRLERNANLCIEGKPVRDWDEVLLDVQNVLDKITEEEK